MLKKFISFLILPSAASLYHYMLCFGSCLFKGPLSNTPSALIGQLTHAWASTVHRVPSWLALSCFQLPVRFTSSMIIGRNCANMWHGDIIWCQKVTEWRRDNWLGVSGAKFSVRARSSRLCRLWLLTVKTFSCTRSKNNTLKERRKSTVSLFLRLFFNLSLSLSLSLSL